MEQDIKGVKDYKMEDIMKIIIKNKYYNIKKEFNNKNDLIDYIKNYIEQKTGEPIKSKYNVDDLLHVYFNDYDIIKK